MKQIKIFSPAKGPTGYDIVARDLIEHLDQKGIHVCLEEFRNWSPFEVGLREDQHRFLGEAMKNELLPSPSPITNLNICLPEQVKVYDDKRNINLTMFEVDNIPENWQFYLENIDEVIVPTDFNHWSFTHKTNLPPEKVKVVPIGFNPEYYNEQVEPLPLVYEGKNILDFPIRFLVVCEITDRKNFWGTLHTFYEVAIQVGVDKCCLLLKVGNYSKPITLKEETKRFREQLIADKIIPDLPYNVFNYVPLLPEAVHPNFIKIGTHYLSTSLGEGWDLTAMQAAACGLHLFVPMHSAYQCWLNSDCVSFLPIAKKMPALQTGPTARLYEGSNWIAFHLPDSIDLIVSSVLDPSIVEKKKEKMRAFLPQLHWNSVINQYLEALHL